MKYSAIVHLEDQQQFQLLINNRDIAWINYQKKEDVFYLTHSEVPSKLRGKGIGKILVEKTFEFLKENDLPAVAVCSFIKSVARADLRWSAYV